MFSAKFSLCVALAGLTTACSLASAQDAADQANEIARLVAQLDADQAAQREEAEKRLIELGLAAKGAAGDAFLASLPQPNDRMPQEVQTRLLRITSEIQTRRAKQAVDPTRLTLDVKDAPLAEVLAQIEKQTGNRLTDYREQFGQEPMEKKITLKVDDEPFWSAVDKVLDAAAMSPYSFSGEETLALIEREPGALRRSGRATYSGPFRIEATNVNASRGLRAPDQSGLRIELEITWEPRLMPIALTQAAADLTAMGDDERPVQPTSEDAVFDVEIQTGSHAAEVTIPLQLPARQATAIKTLKGKMSALVPGRMVDLKFDDLAKAKEKSQKTGGVTVTIDRVVKNQALWEVHMRVSVESLDAGLESHRGWVFQNVTYLVDKNGEKLDHAGFETTMQSETEAGFAYFFELPDEGQIADYTWVYRTPTAIVNVPVEYELTEVPLP